MNRRIFAAALIGFTLGAGTTFFAMRGSQSLVTTEAKQAGKSQVETNDPFANPRIDEPDPFSTTDRNDLLSELSGKWISVDGQQSASLDSRVLRFEETAGWPDIANRYFLLGEEMQFMTNRGFYNISTLEPGKICVIKEDLKIGGLTSFTLYREGSSMARSREPLKGEAPPLRVQELLEAIPTIRAEETRESVMKRFGLTDHKSLELIWAESSLGDTDFLFSLGIDNHWMLRADFSKASPEDEDKDAGVRRLQIVRGYIDDIKTGRIDVIKPVYPYYSDGEIIYSSDHVEKAEPK